MGHTVQPFASWHGAPEPAAQNCGIPYHVRLQLASGWEL